MCAVALNVAGPVYVPSCGGGHETVHVIWHAPRIKWEREGESSYHALSSTLKNTKQIHVRTPGTCTPHCEFTTSNPGTSSFNPRSFRGSVKMLKTPVLGIDYEWVSLAIPRRLGWLPCRAASYERFDSLVGKSRPRFKNNPNGE